MGEGRGEGLQTERATIILRHPHYFSDSTDSGTLIRAEHLEHARESFLAVASGLMVAMHRLVRLPIHR